MAPPAMTLALVPILLSGPHGASSISSVYADITAAVSQRTGLRLISDAEIFAVLGELQKQIGDCGADTRCMAERLRRVDARLGLVVVVNPISDPPLVSLLLLDTDARKVIGADVGALREGEPSISAAIQTRAGALFEAQGFGRAARIVVDVSPPRAAISLGPGIEPERGTPNVFSVPPGHYTVTANADGFLGASTEIDGQPGVTRRIALSLEESTSLFESPWFWGGLGAALLGGAAAAVVLLRVPLHCWCIPDRAGNGCEHC
jgi:hypothetical protein